MKRRGSFVANSSSSSFIISHNGNTKVTVSVEIDLAEYCRRSITDAADVDGLCEYNGFDEATKELMLAEIAAGRTIMDCTFSTEEGGIESVIASEARNGEAPKHLFSKTKTIKFIDATYED